MFMEDTIEESGGGIFPHKEKIFIKIFSDNILLAIEMKNKAVLRRSASLLARLALNGIQAKTRFCLGMPQLARAEPRAVAAALSNTPLIRLAHVPYREPFSDKNDEHRDNKIAALFNTLANIYNEILRYGYLMRGAIVEGEFFHNDKIVYGKALAEAVCLEEKVAKVPRIIVKTNVTEPNNSYYLMQDENRAFFLNIFHLCRAFDDVNFKISLLEMLKKHKSNEKIKTKIMWMINYFNTWFTKYEYRLLNQQKITDEDINKAIE